LIASVLIDFDFQQCESNFCIFIYKNADDQRIYIVLYVDDFLIADDNEKDIAMIKQRLSERFEMKNLKIASKFLDMKIEYEKTNRLKFIKINIFVSYSNVTA